MGVAQHASGDDLDIFIGTADVAQTYNPNVLFIMDTSGSMGSKDYTSESRMLRVQNALKEALTSATNINAGLMRFLITEARCFIRLRISIKILMPS